MAGFSEYPYPKEIVLKDGAQVTLAILSRKDEEALQAFFRRIPEEDRQFLKDDVARPAVIEAWCRDVDLGRVFPLLAAVDGRIVADATLHRRRHGWLRHVGELRLVVDPELRRKGLGSHMVEELIELASREGLEKLLVAAVAEETAAIEAFERLGFQPVARLPELVKDQRGMTRDLVVLVLDVATALLPDRYYEK